MLYNILMVDYYSKEVDYYSEMVKSNNIYVTNIQKKTTFVDKIYN